MNNWRRVNSVLWNITISIRRGKGKFYYRKINNYRLSVRFFFPSPACLREYSRTTNVTIL